MRENLKTLPICTWFDEEIEVCFEIGAYFYGNRLAVNALCLEEGEYVPFADLTVNLPEEELSGPCCAYLDINNFFRGTLLVMQAGIAQPTGKYGRSGYCTYPEYEFDLEKLKEYIYNLEEFDEVKRAIFGEGGREDA